MQENTTGNHKRSGLSFPLILGIVIVAIVLGIVFRRTMRLNSSTSTVVNADQTTARIKFSDMPDSKNSFKIFPGPLTSEAMAALSGFNVVSKSEPDGSTTVTLVSNNSEYQTQMYTIKPGDSLYFIERNMMDDKGEGISGSDRFLSDDTAIVVDANGLVSQ